MAENFDLIFGQNASQQYAWSDSDYQDGWETVGNIPPTAAQFDALQRRNDMKTKELNDNLIPLVNANTAETRQPATAYNEGDMKYSPLLPTGWFLSCAVAGTTSAGEIVLPSPVVENASVVDGTVTWTIRKPANTANIPSLSEYATIASPTFTGTPKAPTPTSTDNSTRIATTAFVQSKISSFGVVTQTYRSGYDWYRIYSDGWVEQGGRLDAVSNFTVTTISLLKPMANSQYTLLFLNEMSALTDSSAVGARQVGAADLTTTSFKLLNSNSFKQIAKRWYICGMGA